MTEIRTPRLLLRRWTDDDLVPLSEINADPDVMRWIGDGSTLDLEQTAEEIERWEDEWDEEGFGLFAVELLASGELIGAVGLSVAQSPAQARDFVAVSWRLGRQYWGQGYASEAAQATLEFALQDRGLDRVIAVNRSGHEESENVIRKLGMVMDLDTTDPEHGHLIQIHSIDLSEYEG
ncbi:GNAT family N-acetyltransferase [Streptomyces sp. NPDC048550]|uniref:GNAT family N-acetyltransferase n=1 Tax=unclassified Streptomyces TaxID=2593676 RepID=UPI000B1FC875|nr:MULTISPECIES: GNAT family N-acetyltransferase [unclassified Streptomyces]MCX5151940.1 GNAT family N-acetyltransferase [Streptomyces sp. NBC_00320]WSN47171.1 GNAT family N-acetyltransferase [Streptomyces sp. NBC_01296]WSW63583.1 GNAT family N-acetyltransferase [Streptomyces sp. NBC_00998]